MNSRTSRSVDPPRAAEFLLCALLRPRDREAITGDLLEEYREAVLPERGYLRAQYWYWKQVAGVVVWYWRNIMTLAKAVALGLAVGIVFGVWDLVFTHLAPLAEDTPAALLTFYGPMFAIWCIAGFFGYRRTGKMLDAVKSAATVAFVTFVVFDLAVILRVNLYLDVLKQRSDWSNMVLNFESSGFKSFRTYANYVYVKGSPFKIFAASLIGAVMGLIGGLFGYFGGRASRAALHS
jgi:hypothetical protein